jgi:hypothetical protein
MGAGELDNPHAGEIHHLMNTITIAAIVGIGGGLVIAFATIVRQLRQLHLSMNSRLDELLNTTRSLARAEGFKAGQQDHLDALRDAGSKLEPGRS